MIIFFNFEIIIFMNNFTKKQNLLIEKINSAKAQLDKIKQKKLASISKIAEKHGLIYMDNEDIEKEILLISQKYNLKNEP